MSAHRTTLDVSELPSVEFGPRSLLWWGTIGFIVIEGFTLLILVTTYFYLRLNEYSWPPAPAPLPGLVVPTASTILILLLIVPMRGVEKAAKKFDRAAVAKGLLITSLLSIAPVVLRWFDIVALNVRWNENAYASVVWSIVLVHGSLLLFDLVETATMAVLFMTGRAQKKHFSDASDAALYQYFLSLIWIPLYVIVYWSPRLM